MDENVKKLLWGNRDVRIFFALVIVHAAINIICHALYKTDFCLRGSSLVVIMTVLPAPMVILTVLIIAVYCKKIVRIKELALRYLIVCLCVLIACGTRVYSNFDYMLDFIEGPQTFETDEYWYYFGSEHLEFKDEIGNKHIIYIGSAFESDSIYLLFNRISSDPKRIFIKYYPHSDTAEYIKFLEN